MRALRLTIAGILLLALLPVFAQQARQRLILKDGSYQVVTTYEVEGDRVRYRSAERSDAWEEVPYALVDWPATEKWNKEHTPGAAAEAEPSATSPDSEAAEIDREEREQRADESYRMPVVLPGLRLPDESGVFALDIYHGLPELVHIDQAAGDLNRDPNHSILRAAIAPWGGAKEPIRIDGANARVQLHVLQPVLYVSLDSGAQIVPDSAMTVDTHGADATDKDYSSATSRYAIVRVDLRSNMRVIGAVRVSLLGKVTQNEDIIPANAEVLPGKHWMKLTPQYPLSAGEYALMEILSPGEVNLDVWDFGVNPAAPENKHPLMPVKAASQ